MTNVQLVLVLLGAFWAGSNVVFSGMKLLIDAKDRIVLGKVNGETLSPEFRRRILLYDWLPVRMALATLSLTLSVIILSLPVLAESPTQELVIVCYVTVVVPVFGMLNFTIGGIVEWRFLKTALK